MVAVKFLKQNNFVFTAWGSAIAIALFISYVTLSESSIQKYILASASVLIAISKRWKSWLTISSLLLLFSITYQVTFSNFIEQSSNIYQFYIQKINIVLFCMVASSVIRFIYDNAKSDNRFLDGVPVPEITIEVENIEKTNSISERGIISDEVNIRTTGTIVRTSQGDFHVVKKENRVVINPL
jgi:hypothetical protein